MSLDFIADTNILILSFAGRLRKSLQASKIGISVISEIELLSYSHLTQRDEQQLRAILKTFEQCPLSDEIKERTIQIRRKSKIKLPDAIICATAQVYQAILLTNDKRLLNLPDLNAHPLTYK